MLLLFYTMVILSVNAQTTCGAYHTRCNGSFGTYSFYTCCDTGLVCKPYDTYGGSCEYGPNYTTPPVAPTMVNNLSGCGVLYTRCNGSFFVAMIFIRAASPVSFVCLTTLMVGRVPMDQYHYRQHLRSYVSPGHHQPMYQQTVVLIQRSVPLCFP